MICSKKYPAWILAFVVAAILAGSTQSKVFAEETSSSEQSLPAVNKMTLIIKREAIQKELADCIHADPSTMGINACQRTAYQAYDALMNEFYQAALQKSDPATRDAIQVAQQKWLAFRDAELNAQATYPRQGTVRGPMLGAEAIGLDLRRISELLFYLEDTGG